MKNGKIERLKTAARQLVQAQKNIFEVCGPWPENDIDQKTWDQLMKSHVYITKALAGISFARKITT